MKLYLDIETIGSEDPTVIAELAAAIGPPKTMSRAETIAKWEAEEKPALVDEAVKKTSFDGGCGRIVCIAFAIDDGEIYVLAHPEEKMLLENVFYAIGDERLSPVGHNVNFDVRFLWQRCVVNRLPVPRWLRAAVKAKPWEIEDTMLLWNSERDRKVRLERLCRILGVQSSKSEMDGSKVWEFFKAGRLDDIATYCKADVQAMRECHRIMT